MYHLLDFGKKKINDKTMLRKSIRNEENVTTYSNH